MVTKSTCLTNLIKLDITHSQGISGFLAILQCHSFPSLQSMVLSNCGLKSQGLSILAQAYAKGRLPELRHLDLSENLKSQVKCLFEHKFKMAAA